MQLLLKKGCFLFCFSFLLISACQKERESQDCSTKVCRPDEQCIGERCVPIKNVSYDPNTGEQIPPNKLLLKQIDIVRFPPKSFQGAPWDSASGPDLYLTLYQSTQPIWLAPSTINDAQTGTEYSLILNPAIELKNYRELHTFYLYDDDGNLVDEFVGGLLFTPYTDTNGFPDDQLLDTRGVVAFRVYYNYQ